MACYCFSVWFSVHDNGDWSDTSVGGISGWTGRFSLQLLYFALVDEHKASEFN